jgi:quercetin dioxygenase-like cupin family protein
LAPSLAPRILFALLHSNKRKQHRLCPRVCCPAAATPSARSAGPRRSSRRERPALPFPSPLIHCHGVLPVPLVAHLYWNGGRVTQSCTSEHDAFRHWVQCSRPAEGVNFTGHVWLSMLTDPDNPTSVGNVTFAPGCINRWHSHPQGQILLVTTSRGWDQQEGKPARELPPGDVVVCSPNVRHWHGAAKDSGLTHLAVTPVTPGSRRPRHGFSSRGTSVSPRSCAYEPWSGRPERRCHSLGDRHLVRSSGRGRCPSPTAIRTDTSTHAASGATPGDIMIIGHGGMVMLV